MEPVEINAGRWYLRALRADDRIDDRPAVLASCADGEVRRWRRRPPPDPAEADAYVRRRAQDWARDERYTWAVCEPTTGEMLGEVSLDAVDLVHGTAEAACWALPAGRGRGMTSTALSGGVARRCGFTPEGRLREAWTADGGRHDVIVTGRLATDR
jgi:RimJ/RimL family protein N-acetyltransferase